MPHHPNMKYLVDGHIPGIEFELAFSTDGSKQWHHDYNFPTWGVSVNAYDLQSPYLGKAAAARMFYDLPLTRNRGLGLKMGLGVAYVEKPFDLESNFHNSAIGSHMNVALALNIYGRVQLSEKWLVKPGLGIHHFSNGAMKLPNTGINVAMLKLLFTYSPNGFKTPTRIEKPLEKLSGEWFVGSSFGFKQIGPIGSEKYGVANLFTVWQKQVTPKSTFGGELGMNYNASLAYRDLDINEPARNSSYNYRPYIAGIYQLNFNPIGIRLSLGSYVFPKFEGDGMVFFRYHVVYNFDRWQAFVGLKSHYAKADNGELGIAYRLK